MVAAQFALLDHLGIERVHACVGPSLGGMQSLCAAAMYPERVSRFVTISACARAFPGSIAFRHVQREAIMSDPNWRGGDYYEGDAPVAGFRLARQVGTISYKSGLEWQHRFGQRRCKASGGTGPIGSNDFEIEKYLMQQSRMGERTQDANTMLWISKAIDRFSLEAVGKDGSPCLAAGLAAAQQPGLVIGVQSDILFPVWQQREVVQALRAAGNKSVVYYELDSDRGHSAFLHEHEQMGPAILGHLCRGLSPRH
jgi:homoserine O-acetyltransferase